MPVLVHIMLSRAKLVNIGEGRKSLFRKLAKKLLRIVTRPVVRGGRSRRVSKRIRPKILWRQYVTRNISKRIHSKILWRQFPPHLKKNPLQNSAEAVPATSQKESTPKFCGGGSHKSKKESPQNSVEVHSYGRISKRIRPQILWRQFPPNLKKNQFTNSVMRWMPLFHGRQASLTHCVFVDIKPLPSKIAMLSQAKLAKVGEGSWIFFRKLAKKLLWIVTGPVGRGGSSRWISKRIGPKILWRKYPPHLKKNPLQNSVEEVSATSQKESTPKFCGGSSRQISKRIRPKILWRQYPPHLKKNQLQNSVEAFPAKSQKEFAPKFCGGSPAESPKESSPKFCCTTTPQLNLEEL